MIKKLLEDNLISQPLYEFIKDRPFELISTHVNISGALINGVIYLAVNQIKHSGYPIEYIVLHELAHYMQYEKYGAEYMENLFNGDFEQYYKHVITIETEADHMAQHMGSNFGYSFTNYIDQHNIALNNSQSKEFQRNMYEQFQKMGYSKTGEQFVKKYFKKDLVV